MSAGEIVREFEGVALRVRPWRGRMWVEARNLGEVLGCKDPRDVVEMVRNHADDFEDGIDVLKITGGDLAEWKNDIPSDCPDDMTVGDGHVDRTARLTLLSELAARTVAMLARTPKARGVRRWLAGVWAEIDRTGGYQRQDAGPLWSDPGAVYERLVLAPLARQREELLRVVDERVAAAIAALPPPPVPPEVVAVRQEVAALRLETQSNAKLLRETAAATLRAAEALERQGEFAFAQEAAAPRPHPAVPTPERTPVPRAHPDGVRHALDMFLMFRWPEMEARGRRFFTVADVVAHGEMVGWGPGVSVCIGRALGRHGFPCSKSKGGRRYFPTPQAIAAVLRSTPATQPGTETER